MNVLPSGEQPALDLPDFAEFAGRLRAYLTVCDQLVKLGELAAHTDRLDAAIDGSMGCRGGGVDAEV